jgi:hypothetical protein
MFFFYSLSEIPILPTQSLPLEQASINEQLLVQQILENLDHLLIEFFVIKFDSTKLLMQFYLTTCNFLEKDLVKMSSYGNYPADGEQLPLPLPPPPTTIN